MRSLGSVLSFSLGTFYGYEGNKTVNVEPLSCISADMNVTPNPHVSV